MAEHPGDEARVRPSVRDHPAARGDAGIGGAARPDRDTTSCGSSPYAFEDSEYWPFTSAKLIATRDGEVGYFPDAVLLDGPPATIRYGNHPAAINPAAVFEIASPGTRDYDAGRKLDVYRSIPTMREVFLIESSEARIVRHFRTNDAWDEEEIVGLGARLSMLGVSIPLARLYRKVELGMDEASADR